MDLGVSLINPFMNYKRNRKTYMFVVYGISVCMALVLVLSNNGGAANDLQVCWVNKQGAGSINWWLWGLFYIPVGFIWLFSAGIYKFARSKLREGLLATQELRANVLRVRAPSLTLS